MMFIDDEKLKKLETAEREQFEFLCKYLGKLGLRYEPVVPRELKKLRADPERLRLLAAKSIA